MKRFAPLVFSLSMILGVEPAFHSLRAQEAAAGLPQAIVVIRHAQDVSNTETANKGDTITWEAPNDWRSVCREWPTYGHIFLKIKSSGSASSGGETITVALHALSGNWKAGQKDGTKRDNMNNPLGELQALSLAESMDSLLAGKFAPVARVITMDPRDDGSTANPFDTVWPYLTKDSMKMAELFLVQRDTTAKADKWPGVMALIANENAKLVESKEALSPKRILPAAGGSALICWTGEGLGGADGIVGKLYDVYGVKKPADDIPKGLIGKCATVWVFSRDAAGKGAVKRYEFAYKAGGDRVGSFK